MNTVNNRRHQLTKRIFHETLIELLQQENMCKITVKQICEAADMNRTTFYAHYDNQMDLLKEIEIETFQKMKEYILQESQSNEQGYHACIFCRILEFIRKNAPVFSVLFKEGNGEQFKQALVKLISALDLFESNITPTTAEYNYIKTFIIAGCSSVVKQWIDDGFSEKPEEIADWITKRIDTNIQV